MSRYLIHNNSTVNLSSPVQCVTRENYLLRTFLASWSEIIILVLLLTGRDGSLRVGFRFGVGVFIVSLLNSRSLVFRVSGLLIVGV